jgi:hemerythrin-like metal-binding protein
MYSNGVPIPLDDGLLGPWAWPVLAGIQLIGLVLNVLQFFLTSMHPRLSKTGTANSVRYLALQDALLSVVGLIFSVFSWSEQTYFGGEAGCRFHTLVFTFLLIAQGASLCVIPFVVDGSLRADGTSTMPSFGQNHLMIWMYAFGLTIGLNVWPGHYHVVPGGLQCFPCLASAFGGILLFGCAICLFLIFQIRMQQSVSNLVNAKIHEFLFKQRKKRTRQQIIAFLRLRSLGRLWFFTFGYLICWGPLLIVCAIEYIQQASTGAVLWRPVIFFAYASPLCNSLAYCLIHKTYVIVLKEALWSIITCGCCRNSDIEAQRMRIAADSESESDDEEDVIPVDRQPHWFVSSPTITRTTIDHALTTLQNITKGKSSSFAHVTNLDKSVTPEMFVAGQFLSRFVVASPSGHQSLGTTRDDRIMAMWRILSDPIRELQTNSAHIESGLKTVAKNIISSTTLTPGAVFEALICCYDTVETCAGRKEFVGDTVSAWAAIYSGLLQAVVKVVQEEQRTMEFETAAHVADPLVEWTKRDFGVDVGRFDRDHIWLFSIINGLNSQIETEDAKESQFGDLLSGLTDYTIVHFGEEEDFFAEYDYPHTEAHIVAHRTFTSQLVDMRAKFSRDHNVEILSVKLLEMLTQWLVEHIQRVDRRYTAFAHQVGVR